MIARRTVLALTLVLTGTLTLPDVARAQALPELEPDRRTELHAHLLRHFRTPEDYVLSKFADHDVVLLGEFHRVRPHVELVQRLVPLLHRRGVATLGTEFARRVDQPLIDSLLAAPRWDEELGRTILRRSFVAWGYREYVDVLRAAWSVNRALPDGARPFRVLALNNAPDWSHVQTEEDRRDREVMRKVWHGETEADWAGVVLDRVAQGEKILLHLGIHHAFTRYRQPIVVDGEFVRFEDVRAGNHLHRELGERTFLIHLPGLWPARSGYGGDGVYPADGYLDAFFRSLPSGFHRAGFDVAGTPFGDLPGASSVYAHGYEDFTLSTMVDGYVYQGPFCSLEGVRPIPGFIDENNLAYARSQSVAPAMRSASAQEYNAAIARAADLDRWCERLEERGKESADEDER